MEIKANTKPVPKPVYFDDNLPQGETISFNTGRHYSAEGQIIVATMYGVLIPFEEWLSGSKEQGDYYVLFHDITRDIKGMVKTDLTEPAIMNDYDNNDYKSC